MRTANLSSGGKPWARWFNHLGAFFCAAVLTLACGGCVPGSAGGDGAPMSSPAAARGWRAPATTAAVGASGPEAGRIEPGPVPDFAPMVALVTHQLLVEVQPELPLSLHALLGPHHVVERFAGISPLLLRGWDTPWEPDESLMWMRDYQPLYVRRADGSLKVVRYLAPNPNRSRYLPAVASNGHRVDPAYRYYPLPGRAGPGRWLRTEVVPLLHENGNLVTTGTLTFVSDQLLEENLEPHDEPHLKAAGYRPRGTPAVLRMLAQALERPTRDIVVLPRMPGEGTGHVDMFVLALDAKRVLVPTLRDEALTDDVLDEDTAAIAPWVQAFLNARASELASHGLTVDRLPMLPPMPLQEEDDTDEEEQELEPDLLFLSPTNALLVPVNGARIALLPFLDMSAFPKSYRRLDRRYRRAWEDWFRAHGWAPVTVAATQLALGQGLLRCASYPVPY